MPVAVIDTDAVNPVEVRCHTDMRLVRDGWGRCHAISCCRYVYLFP